MNRGTWFWICVILGFLALICGWLVPAHLRAVDVSVIQLAGMRTPVPVELGLALARDQQVGAADLVLRAAEAEGLAGHGEVALMIQHAVRQQPELQILGRPEPLLRGLDLSPAAPSLSVETNSAEAVKPASGVVSPPAGGQFTDLMIRTTNREQALALLGRSEKPAVEALLRTRTLTHTVILPPSPSASGQAFDAAVAICGLLLETGRLSAGLSNTVSVLTEQALRGNTQPLEIVLLDLLSLGQRFNWGQLTAFVRHVEDPAALRQLAELARKAGARLPLLFAAVEISGQPGAVAKYLMTFSQTGLNDVGAGLHFGAGGLGELLRRNQRLLASPFEERLAARPPLSALTYLAWQMPELTLAAKWFLYGLSGFLFAMALHFARPAVSVLERPLQVRGFHIAREILFGLGFLFVVLLLSEPFLAQESQKAEFPLRLRLPAVGSAVPLVNLAAKSTIMNQLSLLTLLLFFVLQGLIYTACLVKLAEIRRQSVPPRIKLKLLENEDHLFDAGLYLGFVGTIISLILVSLGVIKPSLMAAYSSTSFGIIFVSIFKIFHLRPVRRKLLLQAETAGAEFVAPGGAPMLVTPP